MNTTAKNYFEATIRQHQLTIDLWAMRVPSFELSPLLVSVRSWERDAAGGEHVSHFEYEGRWGQDALDRLYEAAAYEVADRCASLVSR